ncbi:hypothetical protein KIW84_064562 [Lathyrus oleraceus]|uniref:Aldehyde dehydrogenase domain-containing protein n=1 Tax=Pisum sativum TaxID=3888 RepID=A0A9D5AB83_PEA|nr:hypothetical protein KIW84_064562 [Pisum sativum]
MTLSEFDELILISLLNHVFLHLWIDANASNLIFHSYGLGSAVMSNNLERCERLSKALQAGIVWINCAQPSFIQALWGGIKRSGFGRELGEWGLENYLSVKQVTRYTSDEPWGWYQSPSKL